MRTNESWNRFQETYRHPNLYDNKKKNSPLLVPNTLQPAKEKNNGGKKKMEEGEQYLTVKIVGHDFIKVFPNKRKEKEDQPDFTAPGVAVWVKKVKPKQAKTENIL